MRLNYGGRQHHVGRFPDEADAAAAYDRAAYLVVGPRAVTNFGVGAAAADGRPIGGAIRTLAAQVHALCSKSARMMCLSFSKMARQLVVSFMSAWLNCRNLSMAAALAPTIRRKA